MLSWHCPRHCCQQRCACHCCLLLHTIADFSMPQGSGGATLMHNTHVCRAAVLDRTRLAQSKMLLAMCRRAMIVAPKTLLDTWLKELKHCGLDFLTNEYQGTQERCVSPSFYICTCTVPTAYL